MIGHIGKVNLGVLAHALLHVEEPALGVPVLGAGRNGVDIVRTGAEDRGQSRREALRQPYEAVRAPACEAGRGSRRRRVADHGNEIEGRVDGNIVARAGTPVVDEGRAVTAAKYEARRESSSESKARRPVLLVGIHQRLAEYAIATIGSNAGSASAHGRHGCCIAGCERLQGPGGGVEVGDKVVALPPRRAIFPAQADIQGQLRADLPVILGVGAVHLLVDVGDEIGCQRVSAAGSEEEVGEVCVGNGGGVGAGKSRRRRALAVAAAVGEGAVERVRVLDLLPDLLPFIAELERVTALDPGEVQLGIGKGRVLPLRVGALTAEGSKSTGDSDGRQSAGDAADGRQARDGARWKRSTADRVSPLAGPCAGDGQACIDELVGAERVVVTRGDLLIVNENVAVGLHVDGFSQQVVVLADFLAIADLEEPRGVGVLLEVEAQVALVGVIGKRRVQRAVVGGHACRR